MSMVKRLQKHKGLRAGRPFGLERRPRVLRLAPRGPSTADRAEGQREQPPEPHQQSHGAPDEHSHHRPSIKENTTDSPRVFSEDPVPRSPPHHLVPSTRMRGRGWNGKIQERELKLGASSADPAGGAAALKRGHIDCRIGEGGA